MTKSEVAYDTFSCAYGCRGLPLITHQSHAVSLRYRTGVLVFLSRRGSKSSTSLGDASESPLRPLGLSRDLRMYENMCLEAKERFATIGTSPLLTGLVPLHFLGSMVLLDEA